MFVLCFNCPDIKKDTSVDIHVTHTLSEEVYFETTRTVMESGIGTITGLCSRETERPDMCSRETGQDMCSRETERPGHVQQRNRPGQVQQRNRPGHVQQRDRKARTCAAEKQTGLDTYSRKTDRPGHVQQRNRKARTCAAEKQKGHDMCSREIERPGHARR